MSKIRCNQKERLIVMDYKIRQMLQEDIEQLQKVAKISWNHTYKGIIPPDIQERFLQTNYSDEMMVRRLEHSLMFVAECEGTVVGYANFSKVNETGDAELSAIYLCPDYQGKGIGTDLLQAGISHLSAVKAIYINVEKENKVGLAFYRAKGFVVVSEFDDDFDGHILKTVRMALKI
jgi:ribosomal protein S18 acetylase RimI-like enzyme